MLHINKLIIKNFRPYYGVKTFDFGSRDGLSLIIGDNGIGKSSLLKAIKFVMYDELDSHETFQVKNELNIIAWEEQTYDMSVSLEFVYNEDHYMLKRVRRSKPNIVNIPSSDKDFESTVTLTKNQSHLSTTNADIVLKNIIPKKISEYILFEGETISKYKNLLDNNKNLEIYDSIRRILGVTTLEHSKIDLEKQLEKYNNEKIRQVKEHTKNQKMLNDLHKYEQESNQFNKTKSEAETDRDNSIKLVEQYESILNNNQRTNELIKNKSNNNINIENKNSQIKEIKNQIKFALKKYKSFCKQILIDELDNVPNEITATKLNIENNLKINEEVNGLFDLLNQPQCLYCGHDIKDQEKNMINEKIRVLSSSLKQIDEEDNLKYQAFVVKQKTLKSMLESLEDVDIKQEIIHKETQMQNLLITLDQLLNSNKDIDSQIQSLGGVGDIQEIAKKYLTEKENVDTYNKIIKNCEDNIKRIQGGIDEIVKKNPGNINMTQINSKIKKTNDLIRIIEKSIKVFSDEMRQRVQSDATKMFKQISENHEYDRLEFDEQYGLKLIDNNDRVVPNISSGYMTLITISLIYGLHKNSSLTGTIILDAPFSVLTNFHRDKIIRTFQTLSPQVILLVYKDQIDIESVRSTMGGKLINEFEIYQDRSEINSSYKTQIKGEVISWQN